MHRRRRRIPGQTFGGIGVREQLGCVWGYGVKTYGDPDIVEFSEFGVSPLCGKNIRFIFFGVEKGFYGVVHRGPWCEQDGDAFAGSGVEPADGMNEANCEAGRFCVVSA